MSPTGNSRGRAQTIAAVDVGGTFTDVVLTNARGLTEVRKVPTTPDDPSIGLMQGIADDNAGTINDLALLIHGTTVATNTLLQHDGAVVGMLTTEGFRDVLHIARHQRPQHYSIRQEVPWQDRPLVLRRHRKAIRERVAADGSILTPLDQQAVLNSARELKAAGVQAVVIAFLNSYRNSAHEDLAQELVKTVWPDVFVTTSTSVFPEFREYERFTTAAINAFIGLKVRAYVERLEKSLPPTGTGSRLRLMRSNGGTVTARVAAEEPVTLLMSGPAAGVLAGANIGKVCGRSNLITFDMGGTSADIGIVTSGGITEALARDTWIAGFPVMVPMVDIHTVGAGGGSIAYVDAGGAFRVGPRSAGARPGPACYGFGGENATVTDANVVLGRIPPDHFLGGAMAIDEDRAAAAVDQIAERLGLDRIQAAAGIVRLVNENMANAIRSRTIQRGRDPREFALVAFGGAGPLHAVEVAESLNVPEVIVPRYPGITSALGLLSSDMKYDLIRAEFLISSAINAPLFEQHFQELESDAREQLRQDGVADSDIDLKRLVDCRYIGQGYELRVALPNAELSEAELQAVWNKFHQLHLDEYGHGFPDQAVEVVSIRVVAIGRTSQQVSLPASAQGSLTDALFDERTMQASRNGKAVEEKAPLYDRAQLPKGSTLHGPAIVVQTDSTVYVPHDATATTLESGDLLIELGRNS